VIIVQHIFGDRWLDEVKAALREHVPETGATELDNYLRAHYYRVDGLGDFEIWRRHTQPESP